MRLVSMISTTTTTAVWKSPLHCTPTLERRHRSGTVPLKRRPPSAALPLRGTWVLCSSFGILEPGSVSAGFQLNWRTKRDSVGYPRALQGLAPAGPNACLPPTQSVAHSTLPGICNLYRQTHISASNTPFIPASTPEVDLNSRPRPHPPHPTYQPLPHNSIPLTPLNSVECLSAQYKNHVEATAEPRRRAGSKEPGDHQVAAEVGAQQDVF